MGTEKEQEKSVPSRSLHSGGSRKREVYKKVGTASDNVAKKVEQVGKDLGGREGLALRSRWNDRRSQ